KTATACKIYSVNLRQKDPFIFKNGNRMQNIQR
ncbi:hypothetical protein ABIB50_005335, partial [Mucilaginibacter sp. UYCu711]